MNLKETIRRILREQSDSKKEALRTMLSQSGVEVTSRLMGGVNNIINVLYDGDIMKYSEDTHTPIVYMSQDRMNLYLHEALVNQLGLKDVRYSSRDEKELGDFSFGSKNGMRYKFTAKLYPARLHDQQYYKVVGMSGSSGFGYGFITKKETLGVRYRQQIFQQIIEKYDLAPYMVLKTFY